MSNLFIPNGVPCRACGATRAPPPPPDALGGVCGSCWSAFSWQSRNRKKDRQTAFDHWLARKVELDVKRLDKTGVLSRCEALSAWQYGKAGFQCAAPATMKRIDRFNKERHVCPRHGKIAENPIYINDTSAPYDCLHDTMEKVAANDSAFRAVILSLAEKLK